MRITLASFSKPVLSETEMRALPLLVDPESGYTHEVSGESVY